MNKRKKIILSSIMLCVILMVALVFIFSKPSKVNIQDLFQNNEIETLIQSDFIENDLEVRGYEKIYETNFLALYFDEDTTFFAVLDKRNNSLWHSNATSSDPNAKNKTIVEFQNSTFKLTYSYLDGSKGSYNNYRYSIEPKQFTFEYLDNGFKVLYDVADRSPSGEWFPMYIEKDRYMSLVYNPVQEQGSIFDKKDLDRFYKPKEKEPNIYVLSVLTGEQSTADLTGTQVQKLYKWFYEMGGYTFEDLEKDNEQFGIVVNIEKPEFKIPLEVTLEADHLNVSINYDEIVDQKKYEVVSIDLLPYFGAASIDDNGYLFVPEGNGALIYLNNDKEENRSYASDIYGQDNYLKIEKKEPNTEGIRLPVYGIKKETGAFLSIIEEGAPHASITADVSMKHDSYNKVYSSFKYKDSGVYKLAENKIPLWIKDKYQYNPTLKYYFFTEEKANYSDMAKLYGNYLSNKYQLSILEDKETKMFIDIIGSYHHDDYFLWFPYEAISSMTTFEEAQIILNELETLGIDNQVVRYYGWFNGGINHDRPNDIRIDGVLGGKRGFKELNEYIIENGNQIYYDVDFVDLYDPATFYGSSHYARYVGGDIVKKYPYDYAALVEDKTKDPYYYLNIHSIDNNVNGFLKDYSKLGNNNISLRNLGNLIYSDFYESNPVYRYQMLDYHQDILAKINTNNNIMMENPNDYALAFADSIIDLPVKTTRYDIIDASVPFYQLAIADKINYATESINLNMTENVNWYKLKAIETGSNVKFTFSYDNPSELMYTDFNTLYSTHYTKWLNQASEIYNEINSLPTNKATIINHQIIDSGIVEVTYSNNVSYVINYNEVPYDLEGQDIAPYDYIIIGDDQS